MPVKNLIGKGLTSEKQKEENGPTLNMNLDFNDPY